MSKLTLRDSESKSINDLFMAVIVEEVEEDVQSYMKTLSPEDEAYEKIKDVEERIDSAVSKAVEEGQSDPVVASFAKKAMKAALSLCFEKCTAGVILKNGDTYICLNTGKEINPETQKLEHMEPFSDYYSEGEYRFVEEDGVISVEVDSIEPYRRYEQKVIGNTK